MRRQNDLRSDGEGGITERVPVERVKEGSWYETRRDAGRQPEKAGVVNVLSLTFSKKVWLNIVLYFDRNSTLIASSIVFIFGQN